MSFMTRIKQRLHQFGNYILKNRLNAAILVLICSTIPMMGWLSVIIVAFVTLRKGAIEGAWILLFATLPHFVLGMVIGHPEYILLDVVLGLGFVWLVSMVMRATASWARALEVTALVAVVVVCFTHWYMGDVTAFWIGKMQEYLHFLQSAAEKLTVAQKEQLVAFAKALQDKEKITMVASVITGLLAGLLLFSNLFNVLLARWWQSSMFNPGALRKELYDVRLSYVSLAFLLVVFTMGALNYVIAKDLLIIVVILFSIAGLSIMHALLGKFKNAWIWLTISYLLIILLAPVSLLALTMLAVTDVFFDYRKRIAALSTQKRQTFFLKRKLMI